MPPTLENPTADVFVKEQVEAISETRPDWQLDTFSINGSKSKLNYLKAIVKLNNMVRLLNYEIIHAHYGLSGIIARFQWRCPVIVTYHGSDIGYIRWQGILSKILARYVDAVIVVASHMKEKLSFSQSYVIPCGVDLDFFKPLHPSQVRKKLGLPLDKKLILFPGDPTNTVKNYRLFEEAFLILPRELRRKIEVIKLVGIKRNEVPLYVNATDVVVMTSKHEGSPMVIKEALACNIPIVSVAVGDIPILVKGLKNCYVCEYKPSVVANAIQSALQTAERPNGRSRLLELGLSSQEVAAQIAALYEQVVDVHRSSSNC